jgi:hypothetical protein
VSAAAGLVEEIEITPAAEEALREAFWLWYGLNESRIVDDGGYGDVPQLYRMLVTAWAKAVSSASDAPNSF